MEKERAYWVAWSQVSGVGPVSLKRISAHFGSMETAWKAPIQAFWEIDNFGEKSTRSIAADRSRLQPEALLDKYLEKGFSFWTPADSDYPTLLLEIPSPPPVLYYRGQTDILTDAQPAIAMVGTRNASEYGRRWTRKISRTLTQHGFAIASGMAAGIDTEAHQICLAEGGKTVAVLGTGIDVIYPRRNTKLYGEICERGLILSDYPPGTQPDGKNFPPRNRIIAGISRAVLVMEAARRSGALITSRYANEFGRDVYALPGSLDSPQSSGCLHLANQGAHLILGEEELLKMLGTIPQLDRSDRQSPPELSPELKRVWEQIAVQPTPFDAIVERCGLPAGEVSSALLTLELQGLAVQLPGMQYQRL
ncbi:MAG: DNA-processing protein DprA [Cyanobacteria bacterium P01_E01_bin.42]